MKRSMLRAKSARVQILSGRDHYEVLGVPPGSTDEVIKNAHRTLARLVHPDVSQLEDATDLCARINVAYATLSDRAARKMYDAQHKTKDRTCDACNGTGKRYKQVGFKKRTETVCSKCGGSGICRESL